MQEGGVLPFFLKQMELFEREARILGQLQHPGIPQLVEFFSIEDGRNIALYIVQRKRSQPCEVSVDSFGTELAVAARRSRAREWGPVETCSRWGEGCRPS